MPWLVVVTTTIASGCAGTAPLRVGTTGDYEPFSLRVDTAGGEVGYRGVDIELANALGENLGRPVQFVPTTWPTLMADLAAGRFDLAASGITDTAERRRVAQFSRPYYLGGKQAVVRCDDLERFASVADVGRPGVRLISNSGGTNEAFARGTFPGADLVVVDDNLSIFSRLIGGEADVFFTDGIEAEINVRRHRELCIGSRAAQLAPFAIAVLMPKGSPLMADLNRLIAALKGSGDLGRWFDRHMDPSHSAGTNP